MIPMMKKKKKRLIWNSITLLEKVILVQSSTLMIKMKGGEREKGKKLCEEFAQKCMGKPYIFFCCGLESCVFLFFLKLNQKNNENYMKNSVFVLLRFCTRRIVKKKKKKEKKIFATKEGHPDKSRKEQKKKQQKTTRGKEEKEKPGGGVTTLLWTRAKKERKKERKKEKEKEK